MIRHNVDLSRLMTFVEEALSDPARARKVQIVECVWNAGGAVSGPLVPP